MMLRYCPWLAALTLTTAMVSATAQSAAPAASAPASAPAPSTPEPRVQTPTELRDSATPPGDLRPEERVTPQIVIPLRKTAPSTKAQRAAARRGVAASASGGIDDSAARCEAEASKATREACRASLAAKGVKR